jgi:hypothetical protein
MCVDRRLLFLESEMTRITRREVLLRSLGVAALAQTSAQSGREKVELKGVIRKISMLPGTSMPSLELETKEGTVNVLLGSRRYLLEHNFNPKAGVTAVVKGLRMDGSVAACVIELPEENFSLRLRTDEGVPLWRGGRWGRTR